LSTKHILLDDQWTIEEIIREIQNFPESNENENTIYKNHSNTGKAVLSGKFVVISAHIEKNLRYSK
jgi:hypothetical protein